MDDMAPNNDEVTSSDDMQASVAATETAQPASVSEAQAVVSASTSAPEPSAASGPGEEDVEKASQRLTRRALLSSAATIGIGALGLRWLNTRRTEDGVVWPLRRALETSDEVGRDFFSPTRMAPQFPKARITKPARVNGDVGLSDDFDPATWRLSVEGIPSGETLSLTLKDIQKFKRQDIVTQFRCIEGWSTIVWWTGARFVDFMKHYAPFKSDEIPPYVGLMTPDGGYYVSLDIETMMHPQTLLAWGINGVPLPLEHGAPLRLVVPSKYGVKHIKRIGTITFATERPADYWTEEGYDWYAGH